MSGSGLHGADLGGTGLRVHVHERLEVLLDPLVVRLREHPPTDPLVAVDVAVHSTGMARWLSHQLAQRLDPAGSGIRMNVRFPFPAAVVEAVVRACRTGLPDPDPWAPDRLVWPMVEVLGGLLHRPELSRVARYLDASTAEGEGPAAGEGPGTALPVVDRRSWAFARTLADLFDRYALWRAEMVGAWERGEDVGAGGQQLGAADRWQPVLWRALVDRIGAGPTERIDRALATLGDPGAGLDQAILPAELDVFGIATLPPRHLELLAALSTRVPVHLYVPAPSPVRWWSLAGSAARAAGPDTAGHPLLVSCGRVGDDAARLIASLGVARGSGTGDGTRPGTLLSTLQSMLRADEPPGATEPLHLAIDAHGEAVDRSVEVHACPGPARQAEVLRDVLLRLLADDPTLEPRDVLVMTPDVATFGPLVRAAFAPGGQAPTLPLEVADRGADRADPVVETLLALLALADGRVTASGLLDVLAREPVSVRAGLGPEDLGQVGRWVADTGIRWGIDAADRERHGQPVEGAHTWRAGLDRLLIGATMADEDQRVVGGVVPYDHVEGDDVELVGRLAEVCTRLFDAIDRLRQPHTPDGWAELVGELLDVLVDVPEDARWRIARVRAAIADATAAAAGTGTRLELGAVRALLQRALDVERGPAGFETGAVTLCAMEPMRAIPHRVVVLLGIDDGTFPRTRPSLGLDLTDRDQRPGDPDRGDEDRFLFLEAIAAARQHLVVLTTSRDVRSGEELPPAVPLAELLDALDRTATTGRPDLRVRDAVTTTHPLQPWSPRNHGAGGDGRPLPPRSFDPLLLAAAEAVREPDRRASPFVGDGLPPLPDDGDDAAPPVPLADLVHAVTQPVRLLLRRRLGLDLTERVREVDDHEPLELDGLTAWRIGTELLAAPAGSVPHERLAATLIAGGTVPAGTPGSVQVAGVIEEVERLRSRAAELVAPFGVDLAVGGHVQEVALLVSGRPVQASIAGIHRPAGTAVHLVRLDHVRDKPRHRLELWVEHLVLTAAADVPVWSWRFLRPRDSSSAQPVHHVLGPLDEAPERAQRLALAHLQELLVLHDAALAGPLPLFERASEVFARSGSLERARTAFEGGEWSSGDRSDEHLAHAFGGDATFDEVLTACGGPDAFAELAHRVWGPVRAHEERSREAVTVGRAP